MPKKRGRVGPVLWCISYPYIVMVTLAAGCVDQQWVKDYVGQELESVKTERLESLEDGLAETEVGLKSLREEVKGLGVGLETSESLEQTLEENKEELLWLREDIDEMDTRLIELESTVQILPEAMPLTDTAPEAVGTTVPETALEEVRPPGVEVKLSQPLEANLTNLADELGKLRELIGDVSRHIEHVDQRYQQYHKEVSGLRLDIMNDIDTLDKRITALNDRISELKDTQRAIRAEMAELPQRDAESLEQRLRGLLKDLPK